MAAADFPGVESSLRKLPKEEYEAVSRILYGTVPAPLDIGDAARKRAADHDFVVEAYTIGKPAPEQRRAPRVVRIGVVQNGIVLPTTAPIDEQYAAICARVGQLIDAAGEAGCNVLCLQEAWTSPFFFCTREKVPWCEFAEDIATGPTARLISAAARRHRMVIVSPILERDGACGDTIWNTAAVFGPGGNLIGTQRKNHIPTVGDFNEATYYREGQDGHPVFETEFGKIGINICYGRHHPLNWLGYALSGAEIVFNPCATIGGLSEPLWGIEARCGAIANGYFTAGCNRVGTEEYAHAFTSGDGRPAHTDFGPFYGSSYATAPDGSRTPSLPRNKDGVLIAQVDLNLCRAMRDQWMFEAAGRYGEYAALLTRYTSPGWRPQLVSDPAMRAPAAAAAAASPTGGRE